MLRSPAKTVEYSVSLSFSIKKGTDITSVPLLKITYYHNKLKVCAIIPHFNFFLYQVNKKIHVAVMGCVVNGPGEAKHADIGVAGGKGEAILFKKGEIVRKIKEDQIFEELKKEIDNF